MTYVTRGPDGPRRLQRAAGAAEIGAARNGAAAVSPDRGRFRRTAWRGVLLLMLNGMVATCGRGRPEPLRGTAMDVPRPAFELTDTDGATFDFSARTAGRAGILVFGYTNCPDVCPLNMAAVQRALAGFDMAERERVRVVFITVDPDRDSPQVLRTWLDHFGSDFIGLRGEPGEVDAILSSLHLSPVMHDATAGDEAQISHAARVLVFPPSGHRTLLYAGDTLAEDLRHDLPILLTDRP